MPGSIFLPGVYLVMDGRYNPVVSVRKVCLHVTYILKLPVSSLQRTT